MDCMVQETKVKQAVYTVFKQPNIQTIKMIYCIYGIYIVESCTGRLIYWKKINVVLKLEEEKSITCAMLIGYSIMMKVKEHSENMGLKLYIKKIKLMITDTMTCLRINHEDIEIVSSFYFSTILGSIINRNKQSRNMLTLALR